MLKFLASGVSRTLAPALGKVIPLLMAHAINGLLALLSLYEENHGENYIYL